MSDKNAFLIQNGVLHAYYGPGGEVTIPDGVTEVAREVFAHCVALTWVNFPRGLKKIGIGAFWGCNGLTGVVIPHGVSVVEHNAFRDCENLNWVSIPNSVREIRFMAFQGCKKLSEVFLPDSVEAVGSDAFAGCRELEDENGFIRVGRFLSNYTGSASRVVIPSGITHIAPCAFWKCKTVEQLVLPDTVVDIGYMAFWQCTALRRITLPPGIRQLSTGIFGGCASLEEVKIPNGVTKIEREAFANCRQLRCVTLPDALRSIGNDALKGCISLREIRCSDTLSLDMPGGGPEENCVFGGLVTGAGMKMKLNKKLQRRKEELFHRVLQLDSGAVAAAFLTVLKKVPLDALDEYLEKAHAANAMEVFAVLLNYKNERYSPVDIQRAETEKTDKAWGLRDWSLADWRKIFKVVLKDGNAIISGYKGQEKEVEIPERIGEKRVVAISAFRFGEKPLHRIHIPASVEEIVVYSWKDDKKLTICAPAGSYAEAYAKENNIPFVAE